MSIWYQGMHHNNTMLDYTFMPSLAIKIWFESKQTKVGYLLFSYFDKNTYSWLSLQST